MASTPRLGRDERRSLVLEAGGREFGRNGYAGTRIGDIAAGAGVTKPIVYRHFESKKDLYLALLRRHEDDLATFVEDTRGATRMEEPAEILAGWLDYVRTHAFQWLMLFRDHSGDEEIQASRERVSRTARAVMAAFIAQRAPDTPAAELDPTAEVLVMGLAGLALWWIDNPETPKEVVVAVAVRLCQPALQRPTAPKKDAAG